MSTTAATPLSRNEHLLRWVEKMAELTRPDAIHWLNGFEEKYHRLCAELCKAGTLVTLDEKLWPGCYYARSDANDATRVEDRNFICSPSMGARCVENSRVTRIVHQPSRSSSAGNNLRA